MRLKPLIVWKEARRKRYVEVNGSPGLKPVMYLERRGAIGSKVMDHKTEKVYPGKTESPFG